MSHILIVEDEARLASVLADYCRHAGFSCTVLDRASDVLASLARQPTDAVVLDLMLPDGDGLELCKRIRRDSKVPILITSARVDELDRLLGLELGADDYICKPFSPREVVARIKAVLRRMQPVPPANDDLQLDQDRLQLSFRGQSLALTTVEFALLRALAAQPGAIRSRQQLMDNMYNDHRIVSDRTIDSHVKKLRHKLAEQFPQIQFIESVYGAGYRLGSLTAEDHHH